jgi:MFS family permease
MNVRRVTGAFCLVFVEALVYGYSYPFFSLALEKQGLANWLIGLNASIGGAGILLAGFLLPDLIARFGARRLVVSLFGIAFLAFASILVADDILIWFVARFVLGIALAAAWMTIEIWLAGTIPDSHRARVIGTSSTFYAASAFVGPTILAAVGVSGWLPPVVAMAFLMIGSLVALSIRSEEMLPEDAEPHLLEERNLGLAISLAGGLIAAAFLCGIAKTAMQSLLPLYGIANALSDAGAARMVALFFLGEAVLVSGIAWLADRYGSRPMLRICVVLAAASILAIPLSFGTTTVLWTALFVAGGTIAGTYTLGIVLINQDFRGFRLAVVSTGFASAYSIGSIVGPTPIGYLMDLFGPEALPLAVAICFVGLSTHLFLESNRPVRSGHDLQPVVPNLKYLEDSQFEEDITGDSEPPADNQTLPSDPSLFRPERSSILPLGTTPSADGQPPLAEFEEQMRKRRAEIAETVAKRQNARETQRYRPQPKRHVPNPQTRDDSD